MHVAEEDLFYIKNSIQVFTNAWNILLELQKNNKVSPILFSASFQYALIEYAKAFKHSKGENKKHRLDVTSYVKKDSLGLHKSILDARDQFHAHSDLTILDAKAHVGKDSILYVQNRIHGLEKLDSINNIISLIKGVLDQLYIKREQLEQNLLRNKNTPKANKNEF